MIKNFSIPTSLKLSGWSTLIETGPKQGFEVKQIYVHDVQNKIEIFILVHSAPHYCNHQWPALCKIRAFKAACFTFYISGRILGVIAHLLLHLAWCPRPGSCWVKFCNYYYLLKAGFVVIDSEEYSLQQPWAKCGLWAAAAFRLIFCRLFMAFCL